MKCEVHDVVVTEIAEIKSDLRKIKEVLLGNGNVGVMGRIQRLEILSSGYTSVIFRVINIGQALLIAYLTYLVLGIKQ